MRSLLYGMFGGQLACFGLEIMPQSHEQDSANSHISKLQPNVAEHPHFHASTAPHSPGDASGVVAALDEETDASIPLSGELLGQESESHG